MEVKYETVFGDQSLFDSTVGTINEDALIVLARNDYKVFFQKIEDAFEWMKTDESYRSKCICSYAMRRVISTPTWSVADQKAGKLPAVGCVVMVSPNCKATVTAVDNIQKVVSVQCEGQALDILSIHEMLPIESPEEKAARLRAEWAKKASQFIDDELDCVNIVGEHVMRRFYKAMLYGELPMPVKE